MRKFFIILLIPVVIFVIMIGVSLFDYFYYPLFSSEAENVAKEYLKDTYGEDFVIVESEFSKALGDDWGTYDIYAHPVDNPNIDVRVYVTDDMEPILDNYIDMKWRAELNEHFSTIYKELYGSYENYSYMINVSFPEHVYSHYNKNNTYQEIFEHEHKGISNIVFSNVILNSSDDVDYQLEQAYQLVQHLKSLELHYFSIDIYYYNERLQLNISTTDKDLNYKDFSDKYVKDREFVFDFYYNSSDAESINKLNQIKTPSDLKQYVRAINY